MRIVGGRLSGRRFGAPGGRGTRPTSDRAREALGSALESRGAFDGGHVLDLFAGTGALGFEALSRGASDAVLVDSDPQAVRQIKRSAEELGLAEEVRAVRLDLLGDPASVVRKLPLTTPAFSLVFADAPYSEIGAIPGILCALAAAERLAPEAWVAIEHPANHKWSWPNGLAPDADYRYGRTGISLGVFAAGKGRQ
ncbi:MAG: methyltransferase [Myxococcales bacterium]|nr:RsmD family RNA methyltransferase [Deltaproteobacteria bacterium]NNL25165.1 methyltransferase [Myxococcales bacterium]